jgi:hypothetical protein
MNTCFKQQNRYLIFLDVLDSWEENFYVQLLLFSTKCFVYNYFCFISKTAFLFLNNISTFISKSIVSIFKRASEHKIIIKWYDQAYNC